MKRVVKHIDIVIGSVFLVAALLVLYGLPHFWRDYESEPEGFILSLVVIAVFFALGSICLYIAYVLRSGRAKDTLRAARVWSLTGIALSGLLTLSGFYADSSKSAVMFVFILPFASLVSSYYFLCRK